MSGTMTISQKLAMLGQEYASKVMDLQFAELVQRWLAFYNAQGEMGLTNMWDEHKARFLPGNTKQQKRFFVFHNEVRPIVDKRAEAVPTRFQIDVAGNRKKLVSDWLMPLLGQRLFSSNGMGTFWSFQEEWNRYTEKTGNLFLIPSRENGQLRVSRMNTQDVDVLYDSQDVSQIYAWVFKWTDHYIDENGERQRVKMEYRIDREKYMLKVDNEVARVEMHGLPFLPVIHIPCKKLDEFPLAMSIIDELMEPQLLVNAVLTDIRITNRLATMPMLYGSVSEFEFAPGRYFSCEKDDMMNAVPLHTEAATLEEELARHLRKLFQAGRVSQLSDEEIRAAGNTPSGKALLVLTRDGIQYVEKRVDLLTEKFGELFGMLAVLDGKLSPQEYMKQQVFVPVYPDLGLEEPEDKRENAKLAFSLKDAGLMTDDRLLQICQHAGVLPSEWDVREILAEAKAAREQQEQEMSASWKNRLETRAESPANQVSEEPDELGESDES